MARITYITKADKTVLFHLSRSSKATKILTELLEIDFKNLANDSITELKYSDKFRMKLEDIIAAYLKLRNNENPEYGIERNKLFRKEDLYETVEVLGKRMSLFYGNEDGIVKCLAKIYNELSIEPNKVLLYSGENHSSVIDLINK